MPAVYKIKNNSGAQGTWAGQVIEDQAWHVIDLANLFMWRGDVQVMADVASGNLIVGNGNIDFAGDSVGGWNYLAGDNLPLSDLDGKKLSVHTSYKPKVDGATTYAVWIGAGDDPADPNDIGGGDILHYQVASTDASVIKEVKFNPAHGRVWIHEGYLKYDGAGTDDCLCADVVASATPLQQSVDLDYNVDVDGWITYAGADLGSHGLAGTPVLIPRSFSNDGDWNYDGVSLTPAAGDGAYKMSNVDTTVHRYIHKIPCTGSTPYFTMSSDETTELPVGYFLKIEIFNPSASTWTADVIIEIYRERTYNP